jgi:predicted porin
MNQFSIKLASSIVFFTAPAFAQPAREATPVVDASPPPPVVAPAPPTESKLDKLLKGFYGTLDVSFDATTKGMGGLVAFPYALNNPDDVNSGFQRSGAAKAGPVGIVGYLPALSTNLSKIGYRGSYTIAGGPVDFIYQVEAGIAITSAPGLNTSYVQQSDVTKTGIGYGDTFVGFASKGWGAFKVGTTYAPYKKAIDRLNPFAGLLGDMHVVMGNSGGDNRVEFATRLEHSLWYESPMLGDMLGLDVLFAPGQNRTFDNLIQSAGSPDCSGGNSPGSGNLLLQCDDGGFGDAVSADLHVQIAGLYATAAFEWHNQVNRNSDGIGSNNPIYGYYASHPNAANNPLDFATFNQIVAEFPGYANVASPPYLNDIGDEYAAELGGQYAFDFGLTANAIYEVMRRRLPAALRFQNERSRDGWSVSATQTVTTHGLAMVGWAHADKTPGDPGGQHNYNPTAAANTSDMFAFGLRWALDKALSLYLDGAATFNHGNAHYDIGAGGRGLTTDCHDGTNTVITDFSSAGPTTWGGCHVAGVSTGVSYKF